MLYLLQEAMSLWLAPARLSAEALRVSFANPLHPLAHTPQAQALAAACGQFERLTRLHGKPAFGLGVEERVVWERPFCRLIAFGAASARRRKLLVVAPLSGHYATHLRATLAAFLGTHRVFITDWSDAKEVPTEEGAFGLSDCIDYCMEIFAALGPDLHVLTVCQSAVPVLAAIARMEEDRLSPIPVSATLIGGPVDTRVAPTPIDRAATECGIDWFARHCIDRVPSGYPGCGRAVLPGFLQLAGLLSTQPDRLFDALGETGAGPGQLSAPAEEAGDPSLHHDEYFAVMDLTAEFYLETVQRVFIDHDLPRGRMIHHGRPVSLSQIRHCSLMAVEGESDDLTGLGQCRAALALAANLPDSRKSYHLHPGTGHYGLFEGAPFRQGIAPRIAAFIAASAHGPSH